MHYINFVSVAFYCRKIELFNVEVQNVHLFITSIVTNQNRVQNIDLIAESLNVSHGTFIFESNN